MCGHPSGTAVAGGLVRSTRELGRAALERSRRPVGTGPLDLAPGGVYRAAPVTRNAGGLLHHRFTLAAARPEPSGGGLFSVALSRGSPRVGVTHHLALWSPDLPRRRSPDAAAARSAHPRCQCTAIGRLRRPRRPAPPDPEVDVGGSAVAVALLAVPVGPGAAAPAHVLVAAQRLDRLGSPASVRALSGAAGRRRRGHRGSLRRRRTSDRLTGPGSRGAVCPVDFCVDFWAVFCACS